MGKVPWRRKGQPTPAFLPGESPWTEEPGGYSPGGHRVRHDWETKQQQQQQIQLKLFLSESSSIYLYQEHFPSTLSLGGYLPIF